ncbi:MAG: DUF4340 domain-containing protein [Spirochaetia bacterium]|jgi:hypothetical protein|nr:DUF4340 domain-containing protein [Spirochaetia bacterium]
MNKKIYASIAVILFLVLYLLFKNNDSDTPELKPVKAEPDYILIQKGGSKIFFQRGGGHWLINEAEYPADENAVADFTDRIKNLKLAGLISNQPYYARFGLDPENEMIVILKKGDAVIRKLSIGSTASTGRHTFVRVDDKPEVYQTEELFSADSDMNINEYRDKKICKINEKDIASVSVSYRGKNFTFSRGEEPDVWKCPELGDAALDKKKVSSFVSSIVSLRASDFAETPILPAAPQAAEITVKSKSAAELVLTLKRYGAADKNEYVVASSDSKYQFIIEEWKAKKFFIENISEYKEEKKEEKKEKEQSKDGDR